MGAAIVARGNQHINTARGRKRLACMREALIQAERQLKHKFNYGNRRGFKTLERRRLFEHFGFVWSGYGWRSRLGTADNAPTSTLSPVRRGTRPLERVGRKVLSGQTPSTVPCNRAFRSPDFQILVARVTIRSENHPNFGFRANFEISKSVEPQRVKNSLILAH